MFTRGRSQMDPFRAGRICLRFHAHLFTRGRSGDGRINMNKLAFKKSGAESKKRVSTDSSFLCICPFNFTFPPFKDWLVFSRR